MDLVKENAALLVEEKDLSGDIIVRKVDEIINNKNKIIEMKKNLKNLNVDNSATVIYENIKKLVDRK